jgi:hypothetical protein
LPNIFFRAAIIFRGNAGQLRLEFGTEVYFHEPSLRGGIDSVNRP